MRKHFDLNNSARRVSILLEMIDQMRAGQNKTAIKIARACVEVESERRPYYRRPVYAEGIRFESKIEAAHYMAHHRRDLWENSAAALRMDAYAVMCNLLSRLSYWCNSDNVEGYYWAELE